MHEWGLDRRLVMQQGLCHSILIFYLTVSKTFLCFQTCQQAHRNKHKRAARAHDKCVKEQEAKEAKNNEAKKVKAVEQGAGESKDSSS